MSEVNAKESAMMRVSTFCVASSTLAVFALSAVAYAGGVVTPQVPVPHVSVPHIATPQVKTGGTINSTSAHITVKVPPVRHLSKGNITEKTDNSSRANKNNKAQSLINANIQQTKDSIQSAKDEAADAKASFETNIIMPSSSIIPSSQSIVRIAPLTRVVPFLHLPSPLPSGLQQGDPAEAAVVVILMMVQDGGKNLNQQMLAAEAQMAAKQSLRNLINNYDRPPPAADLYQAMGAGTVSPKPVRYKGDPKSLGWYNGGAKGFGGYNAAVPCGTPCISVTVPTAVGGTSAMGDMGPPEIRALRNKLLNSASDIEKSTSDTDMAITGNIKQ
jgi:hypothetical protein